MSEKKLRIGIIGTGGIAHAHARAYKNFADVEVVAGADIIPGKARKFLDEFADDVVSDDDHGKPAVRLMKRAMKPISRTGALRKS